MKQQANNTLRQKLPMKKRVSASVRERVNVQSVKKEADFDCEHCKHLKPSNKTNRLFCSYHSEGEHQYEVFRDEYCSYFERAESSKKDNCISEGDCFSCGHSGVTEDNELFCVVKQEIVEEDGYCKDFN